MTDGAYRPGNSFLHRVDPRVKLLFFLGLIACLFSASNPQRLLLIVCLWFVAVGITTQGFSDIWKIVKMLRWLLLFTLLAHLFFTPGRTLFGTSWLSYDGLLRGLMINSQLLLAVLLSLTLAWTTRPEALASGLAMLLAPLQRFRVPVRESGGMLLLVLYFFPFIQEEVVILQSEQKQTGASGVVGFRGWLRNIEPLLIRLFDRAEKLSQDIVSGTETLACMETLKKSLFDRSTLSVSVLGMLIVFFLWQV